MSAKALLDDRSIQDYTRIEQLQKTEIDNLRTEKVSYNAVFRIRIRSDPYHLAGSASGNVDLDPGSKKNRDKLAYKSTKIIKIYFFKRNH